MLVVEREGKKEQRKKGDLSPTKKSSSPLIEAFRETQLNQ
jgi:hypothetical protein